MALRKAIKKQSGTGAPHSKDATHQNKNQQTISCFFLVINVFLRSLMLCI